MAHAFTKRAELPPLRLAETSKHNAPEGPLLSSHPTEILDEARRKWKPLWEVAHAKNHEAIFTNIKVPKPTRLKPDDIREVAQSFKKRTTKVDGWHPKQYAGYSETALEGLSYLFALFDQEGK